MEIFVAITEQFSQFWKIVHSSRYLFLKRLSIAGLLSALITPARAELYFNVNALHLNDEQKAQLDLSLVSQLHNQMPGKYRVRILLNQNFVSEQKLNFVSCDTQLCPQLTPALLKEWGVTVEAIASLARLAANAIFTDISAVIPHANSHFDFEQHILSLSVPQAALDNKARGYIPPERWGKGIPMLFTSYSLSGTEARNRHDGYRMQESSQYLNLRNGINLGSWRLRNYSYYSRTGGGNSTWNSMQTWLERDVSSLRSRLLFGETSSPGLVFDSFSFRGIGLSSQEEMLPYSLRGYAPEIRGVAMSNAMVDIRQNGQLLYQTFVSPGEFVISDLYPVGTSGYLEILIHEEGGTVRTFTQAFATPPVSLRKGATRYSVTAGEYGNRRSTGQQAVAQKFVQLELIYGALNNTSFYGGLLTAENYDAALAGIGQGMGEAGAVSLDVTTAEARFSSGETSRGEALRLRYSKRIESTNTTMTLAGYRFATDGYYSFDEASDYYQNAMLATSATLKDRMQVTLTQNISVLGAVSLSAMQQQYWHREQAKTRSIISSWSKDWHGITATLSQSQNKNWRSGKTDNAVTASFSLPLGKWLSPHGSDAIRLSNRLSYSQQTGSSMATTLSGTALEDNNLFWSASQTHSDAQDTNDSTALNIGWQGSTATVNAGYTRYGQSEQVTWGARGAVVAHPYGVTLAQQLPEGSSYALVRAPGAGGVHIQNRAGLATNRWGYAVIPSLAAYQENEVNLDTSSLGDEMDLIDSMQKKVPGREALVLMNFATRMGYRVFLTIRHKGRPLPLGTVVSAGDIRGITNELGQLYLSGVADKVILRATLPDQGFCSAHFTKESAVKYNGILMAELQCRDN